jgi:multidrug efflux pump subunit AcrB
MKGTEKIRPRLQLKKKGNEGRGMKEEQQGPIAWMAQNHVAANIFMLVFLIGGLILLLTYTKKEVFPEFDVGQVIITVPYPGASPTEVEKGIVLAVEEAIDGIDGIKDIKSVASEGLGVVTAELFYDADKQEVASDIQNAVDRIATFPLDAEDPVVETASTRHDVLRLVIYGNVEEVVLKHLAERFRDDLLEYDEVSQAELESIRPLEISIEVPQENLRNYGLTLDQIAEVVRRSVLELSGGEITTDAGKVLLRTYERRDYAPEFEDITIVTGKEGTEVKLGNIATISEQFQDVDQFAYFNGARAVILRIFRVGMQTPMEVSNAVKEYQTLVTPSLPPGVTTAIWTDNSDIFRDRINLLVRNGFIGLVLVVIFLGLFLQPTVAFWVSMGIPISFLGSFLFLPFFDVSINMISLFAYIVTLGIVVDDAIIVGENIFEHRERGEDCITASIRGAREVAVPVIFSVFTTMVAFAPMLFVQGDWGKVFRIIPIVVIIVFGLSLIESLFILPAHLGGVKEDAICKREDRGSLSAIQSWFSEGIVNFANKTYSPMVGWAVRNRWISLALGLAVLIVAFGFVAGGRIQVVMTPHAEADWVISEASLPFDSSIKDTQRVRALLETAAMKVIEEKGGEKILNGLLTTINGSDSVRTVVYLVSSDQRNISASEFSKFWRNRVGQIPGLESLRFTAGVLGPPQIKPVSIKLTHLDMTILERAATELAERLKTYEGTLDVDDGFAKGKPQLNFAILPEGRSLGLTASDLARQVRGAFYGSEALRQQRGRDTIKIMVRLPEDERASEYTIEKFKLLTPEGGEIPLEQAASVEHGTSYTSIKRTNGRRTIYVASDVALDKTSAEKVTTALEMNELPKLVERYPGLSYTTEGERKDRSESLGSLFSGFIVALLVMYCLVAIPFRSYAQSFVILFAIPFGFVGALVGHIIMGYKLSLISMFGLVALSGVVINDSLVLVHTANRLVKEGMTLIEAVQKAGVRRFRPIILTSVTTFLGLAPMIFETSLQARILIPMAISLGFGVMFGTLITLLLVPAFYIIETDIKDLILETVSDLKRLIKGKEKQA